MNEHINRNLGFIFIILIVLLLIPMYVMAQTKPLIPHGLQGYEDCLSCHAKGLDDKIQVPDNHSDIENDVCLICHKLETEPTPTPQFGTDGEPRFPLIPHSLVNRENCLECHVALIMEAGPPVIPHSTIGRESCQLCHKLTTEASIATEAFDPPPIIHTLVDRENCLECHDNINDNTTPQIPENHINLTSDVCQNCHHPPEAPEAGPVPTAIAYPQPQNREVNKCYDCHANMTGYDAEKHGTITSEWQRSIHAERHVPCAACHGGDPTAETEEEAKSSDAAYIGIPSKEITPALCASCHSDVTQMRQYDLPTDQYTKYQESIHGIRLAEGDLNVATCYDCHGSHQVLKANDPASTVYPANVPTTCANCHADEALMEPYNIPTNQFSLYQQSVHGHALLDEQNFQAPQCATCHGTHGAAPPGFEEVANVCGNCHSATQDHYLEGPHAILDDEAPKCVTCHGRYDVSKPSEELLLGSEPRHCGSCHSNSSKGGQVAQSLYDTINEAAVAYEDTEVSIQAARELGMLVTPLEEHLRQASTSLTIARAAQHSLDIENVQKQTEKAMTVANEVKEQAEAAIAESVFRRRAMIIALFAITITIALLYLLKRELDRRLEA